MLIMVMEVYVYVYVYVTQQPIVKYIRSTYVFMCGCVMCMCTMHLGSQQSSVSIEQTHKHFPFVRIRLHLI